MYYWFSNVKGAGFGEELELSKVGFVVNELSHVFCLRVGLYKGFDIFLLKQLSFLF